MVENYFIGREALAQKFARASLTQSAELNLVGLDDASHRRYFRVCDSESHAYILMDAPPPLEDANRFVQTANLFTQCLLPVPTIYAVDDQHGFVLMEDFGDEWLHGKLCAAPASVMPIALTLLSNWQRQTVDLQSKLPSYRREKLLSEMALLQQWFLPYIDDQPVSSQQAALIESEQQQLVDLILAQPKMCVHRDFHSRNLMWLGSDEQDQTIGILDFQDAVWGPASYDLVSLTRDCYIEYKPTAVSEWERQFALDNFAAIDSEQWRNYCDQTALQRHTKVLGLFVRLYKTAAKKRYLQDLPLVLAYAITEAERVNQATCVLPVTLELLTRAVDKLSVKFEGAQ